MIRLFVYGTLKQGFYFHDKYLGGDKSKFLSKATTSKDYTLFVDGMPHMVNLPSETGVKGELFEISEDVLKNIDDLEGHPVVYRREIVETFMPDGQKVLAWAYLRPKSFKGQERAWVEDEFI